MLTAQATTQKTAGIQRADAPAAPVAPAPGVNPAAATAGHPGGASSGEETPVQIIPEPRTNRIFAMGRPVDLLFVEGLVREFDVQTSDKTFLRRKLRFLTVSDFLPIAGDALTRAFSGTGEGGTGGPGEELRPRVPKVAAPSPTTANPPAALPGLPGLPAATHPPVSAARPPVSAAPQLRRRLQFRRQLRFRRFRWLGGGGSALSAPNVSSAPESVLVGRTLLVADNITNSIVAQGPPSGLEIIERLLDQIDVKPDQVMISTVIGQLTLNDGKEFGMDYL